VRDEVIPAPVESERLPGRVLGRYGGDRPGPVLLVVGALHGNEPAGVAAGRRVLAALRERRPPIAGRAVFLVGNRAALATGDRFVERDLNRMWLPERVEALGQVAEDGNLTTEDRELRELWTTLRQELDGAHGEAYLLDLHTSSAPGCPFMTVGDTLRNRTFALHFPLPLILGLEEQIDGPLLEYLNNLGLVTLCIEAGQHDAPSSVDHMEAAVWIGLVASGMLREEDVPDLGEHRARLLAAARDVPRVIEVRHRHPISPHDLFRMRPGYRNFQQVSRGDVLAEDRFGEVRARERGLLLLPLYQGKGDDGFFLSREVRPLWLGVSSALRRGRFADWIRLLPGVRRHPRRDDAYIVDTRIARLFPLELFHLLGFRKLRRVRDTLVVARRKFDLEGPDRFV
jgi:succinylglutamate desuccinylase